MTTTPSKYFATPELYDRMYATFRTDIGVHLDEAGAARGPVLEVCCGNGRVLLPIREAGVDIDGLDLDEPFLDDLRRKLSARGLTANLYRADMRDFTLPRRYAHAYIPFNSFGHNLTQADQLKTLKCCREHLEEGGFLTVVMFHPSATKLVSFDGTPFVAIEYDDADGTKTRVWDAIRPDRVEQINQVSRRVERVGPGGEVLDTQETGFMMRYVYKPEMELLLRVAGYKRWDVRSLFATYMGERFPEPKPPQDGGVLVWTAWKD